MFVLRFVNDFCGGGWWSSLLWGMKLSAVVIFSDLYLIHHLSLSFACTKESNLIKIKTGTIIARSRRVV